MRNLLLAVVLAAGLIPPIGVAQAQSTATVTLPARTAGPSPGQSELELVAAWSTGVRAELSLNGGNRLKRSFGLAARRGQPADRDYRHN